MEQVEKSKKDGRRIQIQKYGAFPASIGTISTNCNPLLPFSEDKMPSSNDNTGATGGGNEQIPGTGRPPRPGAGQHSKYQQQPPSTGLVNALVATGRQKAALAALVVVLQLHATWLIYVQHCMIAIETIAFEHIRK